MLTEKNNNKKGFWHEVMANLRPVTFLVFAVFENPKWLPRQR